MSLTDRPAWQADAACRGLAPNLFFPVPGEDVGAAKAVCRTCPVRPQCGEAGEYEAFGIWGGKTQRQRVNGRRETGVRLLPPLAPIRCGTNGGYHAHLRRNEPPCVLCQIAHRDEIADYRRQQRAVS